MAVVSKKSEQVPGKTAKAASKLYWPRANTLAHASPQKEN